MASTYSDLKIQLMATGENSTTWGTVTNTNLGTAIQEAITGSADVVFSNANVTLTLTDTNASQTARNLRLNCTGTATSGYNLIVPAIEKVYIVKNSTDGVITIKNSATAGIAVPVGKTTWVFNDGTTVVDVTTALTSLTLATPLAAGSGGTGLSALGSGVATFLGTPTSANLAATVTDETGTGSLVFATGPTITLTNASGLPITGITQNTARLLGRTTASTGATEEITVGSGLSLSAGSLTATGGGTVTSVGGTGTVNGISLSGTVTTSGSLTLGGALSGVSLTTQVTGTLPIANGGTAGTTAATARSALGKLAYVASGTGTNTGSISWGTGAVPASLDEGAIYLRYT